MNCPGWRILNVIKKERKKKKLSLGQPWTLDLGRTQSSFIYPLPPSQFGLYFHLPPLCSLSCYVTLQFCKAADVTDPSTYTHRHPHPLINQIPLYLIVIVVLVAVIIIDPNIDYCCPRDFIEHCYSDVMWLDLSHSFPIYWYAAYTVAHVILSFVSLPVCVELDATHKKRRDRRRGRRRGSWVTTMWPHQLLLYAVGRNEEGGEGQEQGRE